MRIQSPSYIEERDGELYVGDTRVTVHVIVAMHNGHHYTPEEIQQSFPTVPLATVYGVIAYYLEHQEELDKRFAEDDAYFEELKRAQRENPNHPANIVRRRIEDQRRQNEANSGL
jgi:uncharacterized protein (DUF433 family)